MKIRIITDSGCDMLPPYAPNLTVLPLTITFGEESFLDGVELDHHRFYEKLIEGEELPTTSQIAPAAFEEAFQRAVDAGEAVVCVTLSSKLSGTYQSARIAAEGFAGQNAMWDTFQRIRPPHCPAAVRSHRLWKQNKMAYKKGGHRSWSSVCSLRPLLRQPYLCGQHIKREAVRCGLDRSMFPTAAAGICGCCSWMGTGRYFQASSSFPARDRECRSWPLSPTAARSCRRDEPATASHL